MGNVERERVTELETVPPEPAAEPVRGTDTALAAVFRSEYGRLVRVAFVLLDGREEAEEVVQEAFARTLDGWSRVRDQREPAAYVHRAVVNLCNGRLRRRRVFRRIRTEIPMVARSAEGVVQDAELARRVRSAVRTLPRRQRECVTLFYLLGHPVAEVAEILGIADGTVKSSLSRARSRLASELEDQR